MRLRVFLAGEGRHNLGDLVRREPYREDTSTPGVLEALAKRLCADGVEIEIGGAVDWKDIRKLSPGQHRTREQRNLLGAVLQAKEKKCEVLVFARDRDRKPNRDSEIRKALEEAKLLFPTVPATGGVAVEATEAWILALLGDPRAEQHTRPKNELESREKAHLEAILEVIAEADLDAVDAPAFAGWLGNVRQTLADAQSRGAGLDPMAG